MKMYKRYLAMALQISLVLLVSQRTGLGQDSPSDLVIGESGLGHAPWLPVDEFVQDDPQEFESLPPDYSGESCDALPLPKENSISQASWFGSNPSGSRKVAAKRVSLRVPAERSQTRTSKETRKKKASVSLTSLRQAIQAAGQKIRLVFLSDSSPENEQSAPS